MKNKLQIITLNITAAAQVIKIDTETNIKHKEVEGIFISSTRDLWDSEIKLSIDDEEILCPQFEARLLTTTTGLAYKDVAMPLLEKAKGSKVKGEYIDATHGPFSPYKVKIYLMTKQE